MPNFTFKKGPRVIGLASIATPHGDTKVKLRGKVCGLIGAPSRFSRNTGWQPRLMVADPEGENCPWKWVFFRADFPTEAEARQWFIRNAGQLQARYDLWLEPNP